MGSVKDLTVIREPQVNRPGIGRFFFSDRYSVFDWGEMPDHIPEKGKALCLATAHFFEELEKRGIKTHYLGLVDGDKVLTLEELEKPTSLLQFRMVRVIPPKEEEGRYDYSAYRGERSCFLIPLEIIYRNSLPHGSSVFRRLEEGTLTPEDLGLDAPPSPGQTLDKPLLDVSTKLESSDRYMTWDEAQEIASLTREELELLKSTVLQIDGLITEKTTPLGLFHEDGKVEFAFDEERVLMVVDAVGTPDECRFSYRGMPVSKEVARIHYRGTAWYEEVEESKKRDPMNWKSLVGDTPPHLPGELLKQISLLYQSFTNQLTGKEWFEAPPLIQVLENIKSLTGS